MAIANLVLEYLKIFTWPTVVCSLLIWYRKNIETLLGRLLKLTAGPVEMAFDKVAREAVDVADEGEAQVPSGRRETSSSDKGVPTTSSGSVTKSPTSFNELIEIGRAFRSGKDVVLDLRDTIDEEAKRIIDFCAGLVFQAGGELKRHEPRVFSLSHSSG